LVFESISLGELLIGILLALIAFLITFFMTGLHEQFFKKTRIPGFFISKERRYVNIRDASAWGWEGRFEIDSSRGGYDEQTGTLYLKKIPTPLTDVVPWPKEGANLVPAAPIPMLIGDTDMSGDELELLSPTEHPIEKLLVKKYAGSSRIPDHTWESEKTSKDLGVLTTINREQKMESILQTEEEKESRFVNKLGDVVDKMAKLTKPQERAK